MPVRPRRARRRTVEWSPRVALALTIGPPPFGAPRMSVFKAAWDAYGAALLLLPSSYDRRPWGFWAFAPEVPPALRADAEPPGLYLPEDAERVRLERTELDQARTAWLAMQSPDQRPGGARRGRERPEEE